MSDESPVWAESGLREARHRREARIEQGQSGSEEWDDDFAFWRLNVFVPFEDVDASGGSHVRLQKTRRRASDR